MGRHEARSDKHQARYLFQSGSKPEGDQATHPVAYRDDMAKMQATAKPRNVVRKSSYGIVLPWGVGTTMAAQVYCDYPMTSSESRYLTLPDSTVPAPTVDEQ